MRSAPWLLALLVAAAALPLPASSQEPAPSSHVNVISATSHGCSPDFVSAPDLRVTVRVGGEMVLRTEKGQDLEEPLFARLASMPTPAAPVQVSIEVEEAEPSGFFWTSTSWVLCDVDPGADTLHTFSWDGGARTVVTRGDRDNAAEATVVFGPGAPSPPSVQVTDVQVSSAKLSWDASPAGHRVGWGSLGDVVATVPAGASSHTLTGLCDNVPYLVRVIRDQAPWHVASADEAFRTANVAPLAPRILSADPSNGLVAMEVDLPTSHDLSRIEVYGGPTADVSTAGHPLEADNWGPFWSTWSGSVDASPDPPPAYVLVRVVDSGGLAATSAPFQVGSAHQADDGTFDTCGYGGSFDGSSTIMTPTSESWTESASASSSSSSSRSATSAGPVDGGGADGQLGGERPAVDSREEGPSKPDGFALDAWMLAGLGALALLVGVAIGLVLRR